MNFKTIMMKKSEIQKEADEILEAVKNLMKENELDYVQSWWLSPRNCNLKSNLKMPQITSRLKLLVKHGKLIIDKKYTSTSKGTRYRISV